MPPAPESLPDGVRIVERLGEVEVRIDLRRGRLERLLHEGWDMLLLIGGLGVAAGALAMMLGMLAALGVSLDSSPLLGPLLGILFLLSCVLGLVVVSAGDRAIRRWLVLPTCDSATLSITPHRLHINTTWHERAAILRVEHEGWPVLVMRDGRRIRVETPLRRKDQAWLAALLAELPLEAGSAEEVPAAIKAMRGRGEST